MIFITLWFLKLCRFNDFWEATSLSSACAAFFSSKNPKGLAQFLDQEQRIWIDDLIDHDWYFWIFICHPENAWWAQRHSFGAGYLKQDTGRRGDKEMWQCQFLLKKYSVNRRWTRTRECWWIRPKSVHCQISATDVQEKDIKQKLITYLYNFFTFFQSRSHGQG